LTASITLVTGVAGCDVERDVERDEVPRLAGAAAREDRDDEEVEDDLLVVARAGLDVERDVLVTWVVERAGTLGRVDADDRAVLLFADRVVVVERAAVGRADAVCLLPAAFGVVVDRDASGLIEPFETVARGLAAPVAVGFEVVPPPSPPRRGSQWSPTFAWVCRSLA
jgi:hypothetical protein